MLYCERCGNKENNTDIRGEELSTKYFTKTENGYKCHGCGKVIKDVKK